MTRTERLKVWIETLTDDQKDKIILETVDYCIDAEMVSFWDDSKYPIWSHSGDRLDGLELEDEDE